MSLGRNPCLYATLYVSGAKREILELGRQGFPRMSAATGLGEAENAFAWQSSRNNTVYYPFSG